MNPFHSALDVLRDKIFYSLPATSSFRQTGTLTPAEFVLAGDYLVYKFPTWSWADASSPRLRVNYLPEGKQFLVTRGVPSHRRLNDFAGGAGGAADDLVRDGFLGGPDGDGDGDDGGCLRTGGSSEKEQERMRSEVQTMSESGQLGDARPDAGDDEESIPDMEDDDDDGEAIIREKGQGKGTTAYALSLFFICYQTPMLRSLLY
jgi:ubiquitin-like-conjugating enzyme ATG3